MKTGKVSAEKKSVLFRDTRLKWFDLVILLALAFFSFVSFQMRDLYHTAGCSYGFLDGHFLDFYDYLAANGIDEQGGIGLHASYLPSVYMIFAIWNIPMKLFGIVKSASALLPFTAIMWAKILPCLVYFVTGYQVCCIARTMGFSEGRARLCAYAYLTVPVAFFGQFILGHYEIFGIFCILMGYHAWLKKKDLPFVIWFGLAVTFKYYAVLLFIPLLLLREKNIWKIVLSVLGVMIPTVLEFLLFSGSAVFKAYAFGIGASGDNPTGYITNSTIFTGYVGVHGSISIYMTVLAFAFVAAYSYFKNTDEDGLVKYSVYIACLSMGVLFCFSKWHPQWLMIAVPFWVLSAFMHRDTKIFLVLDLLMMLFFCIFLVQIFPGICDEVMIEKGILKVLLPNGRVLAGTSMRDYIAKLDESMALSLFTAVLAVITAFKHPKYLTANLNAVSDEGEITNWIRGRFVLGMLIFLIPALLVVYQSCAELKPVYEEYVPLDQVEVKAGDVLTQRFTANRTGTLKKLVIPFNKTGSGGNLKVSVSDENGQVLYMETLNTDTMYVQDKEVLRPGIMLTEGSTYTVSFETEILRDLSFYIYVAGSDSTYEDAALSGTPVGGHIEMYIYE